MFENHMRDICCLRDALPKETGPVSQTEWQKFVIDRESQKARPNIEYYAHLQGGTEGQDRHAAAVAAAPAVAPLARSLSSPLAVHAGQRRARDEKENVPPVTVNRVWNQFAASASASGSKRVRPNPPAATAETYPEEFDGVAVVRPQSATAPASASGSGSGGGSAVATSV
jgi:hypothetical protein